MYGEVCVRDLWGFMKLNEENIKYICKFIKINKGN